MDLGGVGGLGGVRGADGADGTSVGGGVGLSVVCRTWDCRIPRMRFREEGSVSLVRWLDIGRWELTVIVVVVKDTARTMCSPTGSYTIYIRILNIGSWIIGVGIGILVLMMLKMV